MATVQDKANASPDLYEYNLSLSSCEILDEVFTYMSTIQNYIIIVLYCIYCCIVLYCYYAQAINIHYIS
jgi:hypothetical protein